MHCGEEHAVIPAREAGGSGMQGHLEYKKPYLERKKGGKEGRRDRATEGQRDRLRENKL